MSRSNGVFCALKRLVLSALCLFPLIASAHLISIEAVTPFPSSVTASSTTLATYKVTNISTIPLTGIEDQSSFPEWVTINATTCSSSTPLAVGGNCTIQLQLVAPAVMTTLRAALNEHPLPSMDGVEFNFTVNVDAASSQFTVSASGDSNVGVNPASQSINYNSTGTITLTPATGYTASIANNTCGGSLSGNTFTTGTITGDCAVSFTASINTYIVSPSTSGNGSISPSGPVTVISGSNQSFEATPDAGNAVAKWEVDYTVVQFGGTSYTLENITANHSIQVTFAESASGTVPAAPRNVIGTSGNASVMVNWAAPADNGGSAIIGYTVKLSNTVVCVTSGTYCNVTGLTNDTPYTFTVSATNIIGTGPLGYSSPVTPEAVLSANPLNLALSGLGSGAARTITILNTSVSDVTISATPVTENATPEFPAGTTISSTTCTESTTLLANGGQCTITITPGPMVTLGEGSALCTTGIAPIASVLSVSTSAGLVTANIVVLGFGCQYQSGYLFAIDDTTPATSSIGGKAAATVDQTGQDTTYWSELDLDSIWGIDDASTVASPSPNASSIQPATLQVGQLNCDAINDGACATNNIAVFYSSVTIPTTSYAFSQCKQTISSLTDWYLPSTCELGPFGSTGNSGRYPFTVPFPTCASSTMNIQNKLAVNNIGSFSDPARYWSSTENSGDSEVFAWCQVLAFTGGAQYGCYKGEQQSGVRCVRALTL